MKKCSKCKNLFLLNAFYWNFQKNKPKSHCKSCHRHSKEYMSAYAKKWNKAVQKKYGVSSVTISRIGKENLIELFKRDKKECQFCKTTKDLTIDHIDGQGRHYLEKGLPMNNNPSNLRILCRSCHGRISGKLTWVYRKSP